MTDTQNPTELIPPPSRHQLALMIWLCVFPTLTALNLTLGDRLESMSPVLRTFVLATSAVPIVMYGLMPHCTALAPVCCRVAAPLDLAVNPTNRTGYGDELGSEGGPDLRWALHPHVRHLDRRTAPVRPGPRREGLHPQRQRRWRDRTGRSVRDPARNHEHRHERGAVPIVRRYSETLALSWVASRIVESTIIAVGAR